ncbi:MAG: GAF domain-containing sensor histidine kinase, partial [Chloroflexota bacterium]|nr:GAF domain-containing sensor histidine kinase [Chloroflexota bacterium]
MPVPPDPELPMDSLTAADSAALAATFELETITDAIEAGRPLSYILGLVVARVGSLLAVSETYVLLRAGTYLVGAAVNGLGTTDPAAVQVPLAGSAEGWVVQTRRPLLLREPTGEGRFGSLVPHGPGLTALLLLPLEVRGRVVGVLAAGCTTAGDFTDDRLLLLVLADLATLAIETNRSVGREARRTRLIDLLRYVSGLDYSQELHTVLTAVADRVAEVLQVEKVDVMLYDPERDALVSFGVSQTALGARQKELGLDILPCTTADLMIQVFRSGESALVGDAPSDPRVYPPLATELGLRSMLYSPLTVAGEPRGVLCCAGTQPDAFSADDLAVQDLIARRLSLALHHNELTSDLSRLEAERLARLERDDFIELLAHDLKNPLAAMKGYSQLAARRLQQGDTAYVARALGIIDAKSEQLRRLMDDILDVTRLAAGTFSIIHQEVDVAQLLHTEVEAAQTTTPTHTLRLAVPDRCLVSGDADRLAEVLQNLLTNAIRYSPAGGLIAIRLTQADGQAVIAICDQGSGIAPEDLPRIFERAYRGQGARLKGGRGLGLYISREIVRLHSGRIWAENRPAGGACFSLT